MEWRESRPEPGGFAWCTRCLARYTHPMPALLRIRGYRFYFYSLEAREPPHIHVAHAGRYAKFWLEPVALAHNRGFRGHELTEINRLVVEHQRFFSEKWHEYFG